eukprot:EC826371.1.p1 GENE.EC826371.1~~EC826371.1.p1  ORF type:complete len:176 (-),score=76.52 EC826371.1:110-637(-)
MKTKNSQLIFYSLDKPKRKIPKSRNNKKLTLKDVEKYYHLPVYDAAKMLDISVSKLYYLLKKFKIKGWPYYSNRSETNNSTNSTNFSPTIEKTHMTEVIPENFNINSNIAINENKEKEKIENNVKNFAFEHIKNQNEQPDEEMRDLQLPSIDDMLSGISSDFIKKNSFMNEKTHE